MTAWLSGHDRSEGLPQLHHRARSSAAARCSSPLSSGGPRWRPWCDPGDRTLSRERRLPGPGLHIPTQTAACWDPAALLGCYPRTFLGRSVASRHPSDQAACSNPHLLHTPARPMAHAPGAPCLLTRHLGAGGQSSACRFYLQTHLGGWYCAGFAPRSSPSSSSTTSRALSPCARRRSDTSLLSTASAGHRSRHQTCAGMTLHALTRPLRRLSTHDPVPAAVPGLGVLRGHWEGGRRKLVRRYPVFHLSLQAACPPPSTGNTINMGRTARRCSSLMTPA